MNKEKTKKGFFARFIERIDKKMQECSKSKSCCGGDSADKNNSCCSK